MKEGKIHVKLGEHGYPPPPFKPRANEAAASAVSKSTRYGYGKRKSHNIYIVPNFFSSNDIARIFKVGEETLEKYAFLPEWLRNFLFHGRDLTTKHDQLIARVEAELFYEERDIFDRLIETGWEFDRAKWRKFDTIKLNNKPQIEFIDYNVAKIGRPGTFDQHTDNYSTVTIICMLSDHRKDFKGGLNYFYVNNTFCNWDERDHWDYFEVQPEKGDCIFFRGEVVTHGITDVIAGRRTILQIEMQSLKKPKKARHLWMLDQPDGEVPGEDCYLSGDQD